jgi:hypothetical protein
MIFVHSIIYITKYEKYKKERQITMMFKQTKDILTVLQQQYAQIIDYFDGLEDKTDRQRILQLLELEKKRHNEIREIIGRYKREEYKDILETWIQFSAERSLDKELEEFHIRSDISIEEVMNVCVALDNWLEDMLKDLIEKSPSSKARELFDSLLEVMVQEKKQLSTDYALANDL